MMKPDQDPMGRAIADYWHKGRASRLRVFSPFFDEDEIPVATLFRSYETMPTLERQAIDLARGRVLDVGAGSGCHSLVLQQRGADVTAVDISPLSVATMQERGVQKVLQQDFFTLTGTYDTVLLMMNGLGITGTLDRLPGLFQRLDILLAPGGQALGDSSDLRYLYEDDEGRLDLPEGIGDGTAANGTAYYGEMVYQMQYRDTRGTPFNWLYVDPSTLTRVAAQCGYDVEIVSRGEHYDYLARITRRTHS